VLAVLDEHDILLGHRAAAEGTLEMIDGRLLSWSQDHTLRLWSAEGMPVGEPDGHSPAVSGALELQDGDILPWSADGTLRTWDNMGSSRAVLDGHPQSVDGAMALAGGAVAAFYPGAATERCDDGVAKRSDPLPSAGTGPR
jgi:WD40 repeat protein